MRVPRGDLVGHVGRASDRRGWRSRSGSRRPGCLRAGGRSGTRSGRGPSSARRRRRRTTDPAAPVARRAGRRAARGTVGRPAGPAPPCCSARATTTGGERAGRPTAPHARRPALARLHPAVKLSRHARFAARYREGDTLLTATRAVRPAALVRGERRRWEPRGCWPRERKLLVGRAGARTSANSSA